MTNDVITIRPLHKQDARQLLTFANTLIAEDTFLMTLSGKKMTYAAQKTYVHGALAGMKKNEKMQLVAVDKERIVGSADIRRGIKRKSHTGEVGIAILPDYRGKGLGRELMEKLIAEAKRMNLRIAVLHCFENNAAALALYSKLGFIRCGVLPEAFRYRGKYVGEVTMYKIL